jgi:hypothetical protein
MLSHGTSASLLDSPGCCKPLGSLLDSPGCCKPIGSRPGRTSGAAGIALVAAGPSSVAADGLPAKCGPAFGLARLPAMGVTVRGLTL